mgnify:CR=1 FL=1
MQSTCPEMDQSPQLYRLQVSLIPLIEGAPDYDEAINIASDIKSEHLMTGTLQQFAMVLNRVGAQLVKMHLSKTNQALPTEEADVPETPKWRPH